MAALAVLLMIVFFVAPGISTGTIALFFATMTLVFKLLGDRIAARG